MKLNDELMFLERGVVTKDELKAHYKVEAMMAIKEDDYDDAASYLNEVKKLVTNKVATQVPQANSNDKTINSDDIKAAINKINSDETRKPAPLTVDEVINAIDPNLTGNQDLRNLVANVLGNK
ncbi:hypothetical protein DY124_06235 [Apilactobacillus micheneri]|uniref:hypothetical protein n=1 Tax=Apilactobacillus micheneri TaxID=1899430 RepID=UPI00112B856D|nr:hypothetical protein [Apilactobacillus micheneri]TPR43172.1 hypothetical protein DY124_06235 [Apilactobacillus micheneri]TPR47260.1 hypothetical protein DY125_06730 [Apilactobacillus micheneri]